MSYFKSLLFGIALLLVFTSCAASYKSINPESVRYNSSPESDGISLSYQADVLGSAGNKKLAKKEDKFDVRVVAIKVTNNTGKHLNFSEDIDLLVGQRVVKSLHPKEVTSKVKQSTPSYLLYLLLTPLKLTVANEEEISNYNIGYAVGPGLTAINMGIAAGANKNLTEELTSYDLYNRVIPSGETVYGLIGLSNYNFGNISLRLKN